MQTLINPAPYNKSARKEKTKIEQVRMQKTEK